jgi:hypothetical protein
LGIGAVAGGAVIFGFWSMDGDDPALVAQIDELKEEVVQRDVRIAYLRDRERVATVEVLEQVADASAPGGMWTTVRFQEIGQDGEPLGEAQEHRFAGDILYVDARVIKFDDSFVESNDLLRGSSLLSFQRLFGEHEAPSDGLELDAVGQLPAAYSGEVGGAEFHEALWRDFWKHALNPAVARESGVRAMHGEAPYTKVVPGARYMLELRTSGGLTVRIAAP